jgi:hypothetical protein
VRTRISKVAKHNGFPVGYVVKIRGIKFPRAKQGWYFPKDRKPETAIRMALNDYENYLKDSEGVNHV